MSFRVISKLINKMTTRSGSAQLEDLAAELSTGSEPPTLSKSSTAPGNRDSIISYTRYI